MGETNLSSLTSKSDFEPDQIVRKTSRHDRDIMDIKRRLKELEGRVGDNESFGQTFASAQATEKPIDNAVVAIIDKHDSHKIKMNLTSAGKFLLNAAVGALVSWLVIQVILIPQYSLKIDNLQQEVNELRKAQP